MAKSPGQIAQASLGFPPGFRTYSPYPFAGMNVQASAIAIDDREFLYVENYLRLGDGRYRAAWDKGTALYNAPLNTQIVSFYPFTIGVDYYFAVFLSDGTGVQVAYPSGATLTMGTGFYESSGSLPACSQYGTLYLLIANRNTSDDYWAWDGSILYTAGTAAPRGAVLTATGQKYTSVPTATPFGGSGTGLVLTPVINAGGVVALNIVSPGSGYQVGDTVQVQFSGGGSDTGAILEAYLNAGSVAAVNVTAGGSGYTTATVAFSGGGGSGAAGTVIIGSGVTSIAVSNGGSGYTSVPNVTLSSGGGSGATATATVVGGIITAFVVTSPGSGYTSAPTVTVSGGGGSSGAGTASIQGGVITGVTVTSGGSGYTSAPSVAFSGDGSSATGVAVLNPASVGGVTVVNGGSNFLYAPNITFVGGGGSNATGTVVLSGTSIASVNVVSGGQNYQALPTVTAVGGGGGSGATFTPVLGGGEVIAINVTNGGSGYTTNVEIVIEPANFGKSTQDTGTGAGATAIFKPTSIASVQMGNYGLNYTSAPAVEINPGANAAAQAVVALMPYGVSGDSMETYQSRVWIANPAPSPYTTLPSGGDFQTSAPGSLIDFATSDGGVQFTNSDGFLQTQYTGIKQSNGYLYFFGDSSCSVVSNVQTSSSPATTLFQYQNVDPQTGLVWRDTMASFGRTIVFANQTGVFGLYGGGASKVSEKLDQFFDQMIFPPTSGAITPCAALATLFNIKHYLMLVTVKPDETGTTSNRMLTWNQREWTVTSQSVNLTYISTQQIGSAFTAWGTDGLSLFPLFAEPSDELVKIISTKHYGAPQSFMTKELLGTYVVAQDLSGSGISLTVEAVVDGQTQQNAFDPSVPNAIVSGPTVQSPTLYGNPPYWPVWGSGGNGVGFVSMGLRLTTTSPDFILGNLIISYRDVTGID